MKVKKCFNVDPKKWDLVVSYGYEPVNLVEAALDILITEDSEFFELEHQIKCIEKLLREKKDVIIDNKHDIESAILTYHTNISEYHELEKELELVKSDFDKERYEVHHARNIKKLNEIILQNDFDAQMVKECCGQLLTDIESFDENFNIDLHVKSLHELIR